MKNIVIAENVAKRGAARVIVSADAGSLPRLTAPPAAAPLIG